MATLSLTNAIVVARHPDYQLRHDVDEALRVDTDASKANSHLDRLSAALASRGHLATAHVSPAVCVDTPGSQFQVGLKHSFITCTPPDGIEDQARRIVDPAFREQFVIASPSPRYDRILEALPETFVGTFETLKLIIDIVALEVNSCSISSHTTTLTNTDVFLMFIVTEV
jgi:uncharacterized protein (TIGR01615 family)